MPSLVHGRHSDDRYHLRSHVDLGKLPMAWRSMIGNAISQWKGRTVGKKREWLEELTCQLLGFDTELLSHMQFAF